MLSRLGPFEVGQVFALHHEGYSHREIAAKVMHEDQTGIEGKLLKPFDALATQTELD